MNSSRRVFLQRSLVAASASALWTSLPAHAADSALSSPLHVTLTAQNRFDQPLEPLHWGAPAGAGMGYIELDETDRRQRVQGFGAAFTDSSCYLMAQMPAEARQQLLAEFFGAEGMRLSMGRTCIGASDYARSLYSLDDSPTPDPELKNFSIAHDRAYILPVLRQALAIQPELFLFSAPWSPPGWMKAGGSMLGGSMQKRYFAAYAQYFVRFLEAYRSEGVPIRAVTTQNEVDTDQESRMPAALWGQEYETAFVKSFLGPALRAHKLDTEIWLLDHNYDLWGRVMDQLSDPELAQFVSGVAWHGYAGDPQAMTRVHNAFPSKAAYWTEGGPDYTNADYETDWAAWGARFAGVLKNCSRSIVAWNLVLDEHGQPKIGPFDCGGLVTLDSHSGQIRRSGQYHALRHYARAIASGAQILGTRSTAAHVEHVAAVQPDGSFALLLTNQGPEQAVQVRFRDRASTVVLPANAIVSLAWS